jgi:Signal transduction histidine kinase
VRAIARRSLQQQLMLSLMIPLSVLSLASAVGSFVLGRSIAQEVYDQQLINCADSVAARIRVDGEKVTVDFTSTAAEPFSKKAKDAFLYEILSPDGKRLAGDTRIPSPKRAPKVGERPHFRYESIEGHEVRLGVIRMLAPESPLGSVVIQVGETLHSRTELTNLIVLGILAPQLILIGCAFLAVRIGISNGLKPLKHIVKSTAERSPHDLSSIEDQRAPEEVKPLLEALNGLLGKAREDITRQQRFASNAAHQLRTPLAGLQTYLELIEKMTKDEQLESMVSQLHGGVERMIRTVNQLLALSKAEYAASTLDSRRPIDLNEIVSDATTDIVPESIKRDIELDFQACPTQAMIIGDAVGLKELTTNLLENALRYNQPGGLVTVAVTNHGGVTLVVEDNGRGIPEEERPRVFERFYRSASNIDVQGSGLGLSIVTEIARAHDATVDVATGSTGKGTRFSVRFPSVEGPSTGEAALSVTVPPGAVVLSGNTGS